MREDGAKFLTLLLTTNIYLLFICDNMNEYMQKLLNDYEEVTGVKQIKIIDYSLCWLCHACVICKLVADGRKIMITKAHIERSCQGKFSLHA